ncbi:MAG TPA: patatin-like phospholipase family protein [Candidatus Binatia bacterium]|jgi:NTE family protein|nr:patatin-like phospholipase family protein [Candidatus Binatia bacterium]
MTGLVLTAGGARGAYQAGVLKRLGELRAFRDRPSPFAIVSGASAGAINGAMVAAGSDNLGDATRQLATLWSRLELAQVVRADALSLGRGAAGLLRDLALGGLLGSTVTHGLLDATPLYEFLTRSMPLAGITDAIRRGHLYALAVSATSYHSGRSFTFVQGRSGHPVWVKSRRVVLPVEIGPEHVCASAAIPIVFPPVRIRSAAGNLWFGDGGLRLVTPFSPAIRLGASRIFAVGIRSSRAAQTLSAEEVGLSETLASGGIPCPPLAQICGVFLNAIFLDHIDTDLDHLRRMNELIMAYGGGEKRGDGPQEPMRIIEPLVVSPSEDLAMVAQRFAHRMPRMVRYLMDGLGTPDAQSADLMSYLLFDGAYTRALIDIGYHDTHARIDEIEDFLRDDQHATAAAG